MVSGYKLINLNKNAEEIESANKIYFEQNSRVLNTNKYIERFFHRKVHLHNLCTFIHSSERRVNSSSSESKSNSSSSSSVSCKRVKAELLFKQSYECFERKPKLLE